jgi:hypothetical protein
MARSMETGRSFWAGESPGRSSVRSESSSMASTTSAVWKPSRSAIWVASSSGAECIMR